MKKTGFGVIGTGIVGGAWHAHVYHHLPQAELVAVCDLNESRAREIADRYGVPHVYTDYNKLLARPDIAAVSIATPDFAHREIAVAAAKAGKHILVEKPIATTVEDAEAILRAVDEAGVKLMVDFHNRVNPAFVTTRQAVLNGDLGELKYIYARLSNTTFVPTQMLPWASRSSALWFLASHTLDMSCWLLGDKPTRVYAVSRSGHAAGDLGIDTEPTFTCRHCRVRARRGRYTRKQLDPARNRAKRLQPEDGNPWQRRRHVCQYIGQPHGGKIHPRCGQLARYPGLHPRRQFSPPQRFCTRGHRPLRRCCGR